MLMPFLSSRTKSIFFPPFSEADALALLTSLSITVWSKRLLVSEYLSRDFDVRLLVIAGFIFYWIYLVVKNIFTTKIIDNSEKKQIAGTFYLIVGFLSLISAMNYFLQPAYKFAENISPFEWFNFFVVLFVLLRSLVSLVLLRAVKDNKEELISQVTDEQTSSVEVLLILLLSLILNIFLQQHFFASAILLNYIYTTTILKIIKKSPPRTINY